MFKTSKGAKRTAAIAPMFTRYLVGPSLESVKGGLIVGQKYPNSSTFDSDYDYPGD